MTLNIAHRGYHKEHPENTVAAFEAAFDCGADMIELDLHLTKDFHLVVIHDPVLETTTRLKGKVKDTTTEKIGCGIYKRESYLKPIMSKTGKYYDIPTFLEVLENCDKPIHVDIKDNGILGSSAILRLILDLLGRFSEENSEFPNIVFCSFNSVNTSIIKKMISKLNDGSEFGKRLNEKITIAASYRQTQLFMWLSLLGLGRFYKPANLIELPHKIGPFKLPFERIVKQAHEAGMKINFWTVNDPEDMQRLIDCGCDGIITDNCKLLNVILTEDWLKKIV